MFVREAADTAGLILKARLPSLLDVAHVAEIPDEHATTGRADYELIATQRQRVHLPLKEYL